MEVELLIFVIYPSISHLKENIDDDDEERVGEVEEEPDLHRLDVRSAGEAGGHREVDGGQHHQGGDVELEYQGVPDRKWSTLISRDTSRSCALIG